MGNGRVIVVGGGVGGLVTAALLARRGVEVLLLERASRVGGKMRQVHPGARRRRGAHRLDDALGILKRSLRTSAQP